MQDHQSERPLVDFERAEPYGLRGEQAAGPLYPGDDLDVLVLDLVRELQALQQVLEAARLEHDRHEIGTV